MALEHRELGELEWSQMQPNSLILRRLDKPMQVLRTGVGNLYPECTQHTRIPAGHLEGYLEAFANIYKNVAGCIRALVDGVEPDPMHLDFPTVHDVLRGM